MRHLIRLCSVTACCGQAGFWCIRAGRAAPGASSGSRGGRRDRGAVVPGAGAAGLLV